MPAPRLRRILHPGDMAIRDRRRPGLRPHPPAAPRPHRVRPRARSPPLRGRPGQPRPPLPRRPQVGRGSGDSLVTVLGNHDLHLLGRAAGVALRRPQDTLDAGAEATDGPGPPGAWLRSRPLLHREDGTLLSTPASSRTGRRTPRRASERRRRSSPGRRRSGAPARRGGRPGARGARARARRPGPDADPSGRPRRLLPHEGPSRPPGRLPQAFAPGTRPPPERPQRASSSATGPRRARPARRPAGP